MRRFAVIGVAVFIGVLVFAPSGLAASARVAALQVGLRAHGFDPGPVDGVRGQQTTRALVAFQRARGIRATGLVGRGTKRALGARGRPLLGQRELGGRFDRLGRRGARVPAAALRARRASRGREVHPEHGRRTPPLPEQARPLARRDRRAEDVPLARWAPRGTGTCDDLARRRRRERASSPSPRATT